MNAMRQTEIAMEKEIEMEAVIATDMEAEIAIVVEIEIEIATVAAIVLQESIVSEVATATRSRSLGRGISTEFPETKRKKS